MLIPALQAGRPRICVIGASGRTGLALCRSLRADGLPFIPVIRRPFRWAGPKRARIADLTNPTALTAVLHDATWVVSCAHARYAGAVLASAPPEARFVFLGSTRKFTRWPDAHATGVIEGETAFLGSGRPGVMLHPTMIYGAEGENNVQRMAGLLRWLPVVPLPGGGRALVQPIYQEDVTRCIRAVLGRSWTGPESIVIAGPAPLPYRDFVQAVAQASGAGRRPIVSLPGPALMALARTGRLIPGLPGVETAELRRLMEDKAFDIGPMRQKLGVDPIPLAEGLARTFAPKQFASYADH